MFKGLIVFTLRKVGSDYTNDRFVLVDPQLPEIFDSSDTMPALRLIRGPQGHVYARDFGDDHVMFGGNWLVTSDSRFQAVSPNGVPIPIHDRREVFKWSRP